MKSTYIVLASMVLASLAHAADPVGTRYCNPEKSKPCGNACISKAFTCHKGPGLAKAGTRPAGK